MSKPDLSVVERYEPVVGGKPQFKGAVLRQRLSGPALVALRNDLVRVRDMAEQQEPHPDLVSEINRIIGVLTDVQDIA